MSEITVTELNIHPVKSLKAISLQSAELTPLGLAHDRRYMVVRDNGKFVTQRDNGRLALIKTSVEPDGIRLALDGQGEILIEHDASPGRDVNTDVWGVNVLASDLGDELGGWLTEAAKSKSPLRLVMLRPGWENPDRYADAFGDGVTTAFADAAPYLVAAEESLAVLNAELVQRGFDAVPMNRFRANIVIRGLDAFAEHSQAILTGPGYSLRLCVPCERCVVTTIDQDTGLRHLYRQPWKTLADINPMPENPRAPAFAQYAVLQSGNAAQISVGDVLSIG